MTSSSVAPRQSASLCTHLLGYAITTYAPYFCCTRKAKIVRNHHKSHKLIELGPSESCQFPPMLPTCVCHMQHILSVNWRHIHWLSVDKGENKGSVLLWYSCFDRSILMFLMGEGLQCRISILKHCLMKLWNDIISWLLFSPLPKLGQLSGCDVSWPREW